MGRTQNCVLQVGENFTFPANLSLEGIQIQYGKNITLGQTTYDPNNVSGNLQKHMFVAYNPTPIRTPNMNSSTNDIMGVTKQVVVDANGVFGVKTSNSNSIIDTTYNNNSYWNRSGNFGIGIKIPLEKLQVAGNAKIDGNIITNTLQIGNMVSLPSGYKFAIAGNMIAEQVKVKKQVNWPDFVFAKEYKLPTLASIEQFINENKHLPEIPSAKEVEKDGQDLGEMNRLLLKKVEELTLYLIDQNKKFESQQKEIDSLKEKLK